MISLRELRIDDAMLMLEWMHDLEIQQMFKKNMLERTLEDAIEFCKNSKIPNVIRHGQSIHFAIVDDKEDEYLGTISLKNIDLENRNAEYAISTRKKIHGKGIAQKATELILEKAFENYKLHRVYLNVMADNYAAIHLYEKCGFKPEGEFREHIKRGDNFLNWKWYGILDDEYSKKKSGGGYKY